jgi:hypothetical protein
MSVLTDLRNRGIPDVFFVVCDGLKRLPDVVANAWPQAIVQTCIVHYADLRIMPTCRRWRLVAAGGGRVSGGKVGINQGGFTARACWARPADPDGRLTDSPLLGRTGLYPGRKPEMACALLASQALTPRWDGCRADAAARSRRMGWKR